MSPATSPKLPQMELPSLGLLRLELGRAAQLSGSLGLAGEAELLRLEISPVYSHVHIYCCPQCCLSYTSLIRI